jgi:hypothetical protein
VPHLISISDARAGLGGLRPDLAAKRPSFPYYGSDPSRVAPKKLRVYKLPQPFCNKKQTLSPKQTDLPSPQEDEEQGQHHLLQLNKKQNSPH